MIFFWLVGCEYQRLTGLLNNIHNILNDFDWSKLFFALNTAIVSIVKNPCVSHDRIMPDTAIIWMAQRYCSTVCTKIVGNRIKNAVSSGTVWVCGPALSPGISPLGAWFWHHENCINLKVILNSLTTFIQATNAGLFFLAIPLSVPYLTLCLLLLVARIRPVQPTAFNTAHHGNNV